MNRDTIGRFAKKSKWTLGVILFVSVYGFAAYTGYASRPLVDEVIKPMFVSEIVVHNTKVLSAREQEREDAIVAYMNSAEGKQYFRNRAEQVAGMELAKKHATIAQDNFSFGLQAEQRNAATETASISTEGVMEAGMDIKSAVKNLSQAK